MLFNFASGRYEPVRSRVSFLDSEIVIVSLSMPEGRFVEPKKQAIMVEVDFGRSEASSAFDRRTDVAKWELH